MLLHRLCQMWNDILKNWKSPNKKLLDRSDDNLGRKGKCSEHSPTVASNSATSICQFMTRTLATVEVGRRDPPRRLKEIPRRANFGFSRSLDELRGLKVWQWRKETFRRTNVRPTFSPGILFLAPARAILYSSFFAAKSERDRESGGNRESSADIRREV